MSLLDCIVSIPDFLNNIVNNSEDIKIKIKDYIKDRKVKEIVFVASGTSLNASKVTRYFAKDECGFDVQCFYPNDFVNYTNYINPDAFYVFVSQGGATKLVYDALEKAKNLPCIFNNWAVFYHREYETNHLLNETFLKKKWGKPIQIISIHGR